MIKQIMCHTAVCFVILEKQEECANIQTASPISSNKTSPDLGGQEAMASLARRSPLRGQTSGPAERLYETVGPVGLQSAVV